MELRLNVSLNREREIADRGVKEVRLPKFAFIKGGATSQRDGIVER